MNWCRRHLNWTYFLANLGAMVTLLGVLYLVDSVLHIELLYYALRLEYRVIDLLRLLLSIVMLIPATAWYLRQKGRSLGWIGLLFIPYCGWIALFFLENRRRIDLTVPDSE